MATFDWNLYQTPQQLMESAASGGQMLGRAPGMTTQPAPTSTTAGSGNTMGMTPEQEAAIRQWSATGGQAGPTGTATQPQAGGGDALGFIAQWQKDHAGDASDATYNQLAQELKTRFGVVPAPGANGPSRNEFTINGEKVKVRGAEDSANPTWFAYGSDDGWRPGGESGGMGGGYSTTGANNLASFSAPGLAAPYTQEFHARSPEEIKNDPAYQFQLQQGAQALERSKAAQGTIFTGGMLKDLTDFSEGLASTYNDKYYNRDIGEYQMNRDTFWNNQNNAFNKLSDFSRQGLSAAQTQTGAGSGYADNAQTGANNLGNLATGQANANAGAAIAGANATNTAGTAIANGLGEIDWGSLFGRRAT